MYSPYTSSEFLKINMANLLSGYIVIIFTITSVCTVSYRKKLCNGRGLQDIEPRGIRNVQINRLRGVWYGVSWIPPQTTFPPEFGLSNFVLNFRDFGRVIIANVSGRPAFDQEKCLYETASFIRTRNPAIFIWTTDLRYLGREVEWRLIDTDYTTYFIKWACLKRNNVGRCIDADTAAFSRRPALFTGTTLRRIVNAYKRLLCLDFFTDVFSSPLNNICPTRFGRQIVTIPRTNV